MQETSTKPINPGTLPSEIPIQIKDEPKPLLRILREPLLHFLVLGALLFGLYFWASPGAMTSSSPEKIDISADIITFVKSTWQQQWGRSPSPKELQALMDNFVRDEVLYREAIALGLDKNDTIVRRRLIQKMEFLTEDVFALGEPSEEALQAYLAENSDRYTIPGRFSFKQIYFSRELRGDKTETDARDLLSQLQENPNLEASQRRGDRSMLPATYTLASTQKLTNTFGGTLAREMAAMTETGWQGPFHSAYGSHLVNVTQIDSGHPATLQEVRKEVRRDYLRDRRQEQDEQFYQQLRDRYNISIDEDALQNAMEEG